MKTKVCRRCGQSFPYNDEYFAKNYKNRSGLGACCIPCAKLKQKIKYKKHYEANKKKINSKIKQYKENNKEKKKQQAKEYYQKNREAILEKNKTRYRNKLDYYTKVHAEYRSTHKEQSAMLSARYKARKKNTLCTLTNSQWEEIKKAFDNKCAYCGKEKVLHKEHFIPVKNGGDFTCNNIIPACKSCNSSKNASSFFDWYPNFQHYSKRREQRILKFLGYSGEFQQLSLAEAKFVS